ncbi:MAG: hypothetical protein AAB554_02000 [Patescibacteria group bacterium]
MPDDTDADRFFTEAEAYLYKLANERGIGLALGRWKHPKYGLMRVRAIYGQAGATYFRLVFCATDAWLAIGQARLWWYVNDWFEPFEFKDIERRPPMAEAIINAGSDLESEIGARLRWLEGQHSIETAIGGIYGKALSGLAHIEDARNDVRVALASEIPKGDEEDAE